MREAAPTPLEQKTPEPNKSVAGYDPKDPTTSQVPVPDYAQSLTGEIKDLRIGVLEQMMGDEVESETRLLVHRAIDVLIEALPSSAESASLQLAW